jgi:hypothetical protein
MNALLGLPDTAAARSTSCIIDARLALSPGGILLALRLSRRTPVWLTRSFWELVDGAYFYRSFPGVLGPESEAEAGEGFVDGLTLWHTAWLNGSLNGVFFWIGDARRESALPASWSGDVITRYESLARSFDPPAAREGNLASDPLKQCGKEAFALAAALAADPPIILTVAPSGRGRPLICREVENLAKVHDPHKPRNGSPYKDRFLPGDIGPLVGQLGELGIRNAAVHTLAPGAVSLPSEVIGEDANDAERSEAPARAQPWIGAHVFWHEVQ